MSTPGSRKPYGRVWGIGGNISCRVVADLTITHGRTTFGFGQAGNSTATFTVLIARGEMAEQGLGHCGDHVAIDTGYPPSADPWADAFGPSFGPDLEAVWRRRFTGHITDIDYEWRKDELGTWFLEHRVTAVGNVARLGSRLVPRAAWGALTARQRAAAILDQAAPGGWLLNAGNFVPPLLADPEPDPDMTALAALEDLSPTAEGLLFDTPDGLLVWQELSYRRGTPIVELPCDAVTFAPGFTESIDLLNAYTVRYGGDAAPGQVESSEAASIARYGRWAESGQYPYVSQADAVTKAVRVVRRQAFPSVLLPGVTVLLHNLGTAAAAVAQGLRVGDRVRLPRLPDPYPASNVGLPQNGGVWVVEGWTEHVGSKDDPEREWALTLVLSPPIWSVVAMTWDELYANFPGKRTWDQWRASGETWDELGVL